MSQLSDLQKIELDILFTFKLVAEQEGLNWFIFFGTLLGAVRQKGFIPWDDDIDIVLPRVDYDRLRLSSGWFSEPYFLQTPHNDPAAAPRFLKLCRSDTTVLNDFPTGLTRGGNKGAHIDIFPLDEVPNSATARELNNIAHKINQQMLASAALDECDKPNISEYKERFCYELGGIAGHYQFFADRYESFCSQYTDKPYYAILALPGVRGCRVYDKKWFNDSVLMDFEDVLVPAPISFNEVLVASFPDGLLVPDEKERESRYHDDCIIDMKKSYRDYLSRYTDMLKDIENKKVYIFGAGDSLRIWLERYGNGLNIVCAFDNSKSKWGTTSYGVPVRPPAVLPELIDENSRLIIASLYHKEIAKQVDILGISDYYIFIDGMGYSEKFSRERIGL